MVAHCYCSNLVVSRQLIAVDGIPTIGALAYICSRILVSVLCKTTNPVFTSCRGRVGFAIGVARNGLVQDRLRQKLREARRYRAASFLHAKNNKSDMSASATLASRGTRRVEETCEVPGDGALTPPGGSGRRSHPVGLGDEVSKVWFLAVAGKELVEAGAAFAHDKGAPTHDSCLRHNRRLDSLAMVLLKEKLRPWKAVGVCAALIAERYSLAWLASHRSSTCPYRRAAELEANPARKLKATGADTRSHSSRCAERPICSCAPDRQSVPG